MRPPRLGDVRNVTQLVTGSIDNEKYYLNAIGMGYIIEAEECFLRDGRLKWGFAEDIY